MKTAVLLASFAFLFALFGSATQTAMARDLFVTYPNQTFIKTDTGETGLFIEGQNWYALIDLSGFEDSDMPFVAPSQFLYQNYQNIVRVSAFAEPPRKGTDPEFFMSWFVPKEFWKKLNDKTISVDKRALMTSVHYCPTYKGYCFDFHFSTQDETQGMKKIEEVINSIKFIEGTFSNVKLKKLFYTADKRLQMLIPDHWKYRFQEATQDFPPTIYFNTAQEERYQMAVTIYPYKDDRPALMEKARSARQYGMSQVQKHVKDKPTLHEFENDRMHIFYFQVDDKNYNPEDKKDYRFITRGWAVMERSIVFFSIFYRESGLEEAKLAWEAMTTAHMVDLSKDQRR